jgi:hypothetical protein
MVRLSISFTNGILVVPRAGVDLPSPRSSALDA